MKIGVVALTRGGKELAAKLVEKLDNATLLKGNQKIAEKLASHWNQYDGFVCIMATGIVVRSIAPLLSHKHHDPCVIVMDETARHVISLLSGHIGGGNELTTRIAAFTGGTPVITTSSDSLNLVALDLWLKDQKLIVDTPEEITKISAKLVNKGHLNIFSEVPVDSLPPGLSQVQSSKTADIIVSLFSSLAKKSTLVRPVNLVVGIGCNRGTPVSEFEEALDELLQSLDVKKESIRNLASIDKKNDEQGLLQFAANNNWSIDFFDKKAINNLNNLEISFAALKAVGAIGVAEPTALLSGASNLLLSRKRKWKNITMAVAQAPFTLSVQAQDQ